MPMQYCPQCGTKLGDPQATVMGRFSPTAVKKRKPSAWQTFVKVQSKRPMYKKMNNTRRLKAIGVAWRKTPAGKRSKR